MLLPINKLRYNSATNRIEERKTYHYKKDRIRLLLNQQTHNDFLHGEDGFIYVWREEFDRWVNTHFRWDGKE